ncbi:MAG: hypothetical protein DHS20C01_29970 [marine bacterium B5-7]|nr:MAG: hypothetical protein DHS20C01_29970 [marine bacterium B5-7]
MLSNAFATHLDARQDMQKRFIALRDRLVDIIDQRPVIYIPNPGNLGDGLIRFATLKFLADAGIKFTEQQSSDHLSSDMTRDTILIYGGGGGWCDYWNDGAKFVDKTHSLFHHIIVLPSSYQRCCKADNVKFFARDRFESIDYQPGAVFCDDMSFYSSLVTGKPVAPEGSIGHFFRGDAEGALWFKTPPDNFDVSTTGDHLTHPAQMIYAIERYAHIRTDRLHVAIVGALLNKRVDFHAGNYFKNRAVYESSLRENFINVRFYDNPASN